MKTNSSVVLFILAFMAIGSTNPERRITSESIDTFIKQSMEDAGIVGLAAAIIVDEKLDWIKGYGFADKDSKSPFTPNTVMNIASISKTITGACLMRAVEEKKLSLDEDINSYLPFKMAHPLFPQEKITLRQLATHTAGILDRPQIYDSTYHFGGDSPEPLGEFLKNVSTVMHYDRTKRVGIILFINTGLDEEGAKKYESIADALWDYAIELKKVKK